MQRKKLHITWTKHIAKAIYSAWPIRTTRIIMTKHLSRIQETVYKLIIKFFTYLFYELRSFSMILFFCV